MSKIELMFFWVDAVIRVVDAVVVEVVSVVEVVVSSVISCTHITDVTARKITRRWSCFFISITSREGWWSQRCLAKTAVSISMGNKAMI